MSNVTTIKDPLDLSHAALAQLFEEFEALCDPTDLLLDHYRIAARVIRHDVLAKITMDLVDGDCAVARLVHDAIWPRHQEPPPTWWRTPVGRLIGLAIGNEMSQEVSQSFAAAMLGCGKGSIPTLIRRGKLVQHPANGGIVKSSVLHRIANLQRVYLRG